MKKLSKLLLALSFALSITSSAFAVTVASWGGAYTESTGHFVIVIQGYLRNYLGSRALAS